MNRQLNILTILLLAYKAVSGQNPETPDTLDPIIQRQLIIKNNVKSVKIYSCDTTKKEYSCLQYIYDKTGKKIQEIHCGHNESYSFNYSYDKSGNETLCC
ncbi:MAG: hypothetical protein HY840_10750 [Bacteroidetes bacterium]|nr:hypothetical protein [Bacteroidota bacterium]